MPRGGKETDTRAREPIRPFDPRNSGWADLIRSDMESWFPSRLPLRFEQSSGRLSGLRGRASLAIVGALVATAAAMALLGRRFPERRRRLGPKGKGGG
jgi:hypothetical protein